MYKYGNKMVRAAVSLRQLVNYIGLTNEKAPSNKKMKADSQTLNNRRYLTPPHPFKQRAYPPPTEAKRFLWRMREPSAWGWSATREVGAEERKYSCLYHLFHIKRLRI
jgi:hypothetical protein